MAKEVALMPWKTVKPMDQKIQLIADWQTEQLSITALSQKYNVSRPTAYKWINRYQQLGIDGLKEQDKTPVYSPHQTPNDIVNLIIKEKRKNKNRGPKKVLAQLKKKYPRIKWPSANTVGNWLKKYGLVKRKKRRRPVPPYTEPFLECQESNAVWSADYKGQFFTKDKKICYPLTISDNYSRYLIKCQGLPGPRYQETKTVFEAAFREYGLPYAIRTDNGTPFAGRSAGGLSRLMVWWIQLGIKPERIKKANPQQNGRHERMHRTLKEETLNPIAYSLKEQQRSFNWFCFDYNNYRPHEALGQNTPSIYYKKSTRLYLEKPIIPDYDLCYKVRKVRYSGEIKFKNKMYGLTTLLTGQPVGLKQTTEDAWNVYYSFYKVATIDLRKNKIIK